MPLKETQKLNPITASPAQVLTVNVDKRVASPNDVVTISGSLTENGTPVPNEEIALDLGGLLIGSTYTDASGNYSFSWTVPYSMLGQTLPCYDWDVTARSLRASATTKLAIAYRTQITLNSPPEVTVNQPFTVDGTLTYEYSPGTWLPLSGRNVKILLDSTLQATATTDTSGKYSATITITSLGTYTLTALFEGEGLPTGTTAAWTRAPIKAAGLREIMAI